MRKIIYTTIVLIFTTLPIFAFNPLVKYHKKLAERSFNRMAYSTAVKHYKYIYNNGYKDTTYVVRNMAISYQKMGQPEDAKTYYDQLCADIKSSNTDDLYRYAQVLRKLGDYKQADVIIDEIGKRVVAEGSSERFKKTYAAVKDLKYNSVVTINNAEFNTENSDFGAVRYNDGVVFASSRENNDIVKWRYKWKNQPFLDLYFMSDTGSVEAIKGFSRALNSSFHEGAVCFTKDKNEIYFTRNNIKYGIVAKRDQKGINNLKIYHAEYVDGKWRNVESLPFNSDDYSCGHPTLSPDGKRLYFVSDMPGGLGGTDIYYADKTDFGWSEPKNLGSDINTEDNEMFPFIDGKGRLFLASNGHVGLGGLDIFVALPQDKGGYGNISNMGTPINSTRDDFSFYLADGDQTGYLSSDREGGKGDDDIYNVSFDMPLLFDQLLTLRFYDADTKEPLNDVKVKLGDNDKLSPNGTIEYNVLPGSNYALKATKNGFNPVTEQLSFASDLVKPVVKDIYLKKADYYGLKGFVFKVTKDNPFAGVSVKLMEQGGDMANKSTDAEGNFVFDLKKNQDYMIVLEAPGYFTKRADISTKDMAPGVIDVNKIMNLAMEEIKKDATIEIPNIYYDLGKATIRKDAAVELDKVVEFLNDNPMISIELGSHSDSRGGARMNQSLSQRRAESAVAYIIKHGVAKNRITAKGYGESKLKNKCKDGVKCSEKMHQENRRTEIRITKIKTDLFTYKR